ncbi:MAG: GumC family protein [Sphingomonadaceae bacterium]
MNAPMPFPRERRLIQFWHVAREGLPSAGRYRRYLLILVPLLATFWAATAAYLLLMPESYSSRFTLILPGSGVGSSLNVESIGQAQSSATSAFSSSTLSPTENYKQLITADVTLRKAARISRDEEGDFPEPAIKLIDQTNLISVDVRGPSSKIARKRAEAVRQAFLEQLDELRADEAEKREFSDRKHLETLAEKVKDTQRKLIAFQASHGLATLDQFNSRISSVDILREKEREMRTTLRQQAGIAGRLGGSLQTGTGGANVAMRLRGDPVFQELATRYATSSADAEQKSGTLGPEHAAMAQATSERQELRTALVNRGRTLTGLSPQAILNSVDMQLADGRSNLMQAMVVGDAQAAGTGAALAEIRRDLAREKSRSPKLISQASELADLQRDHRVAEAVFSSALARVDTNKQDPYASYPLVQTLADPSLPRSASSPSLIIALAGAVASSILLIVAFLLLWLRQPILNRILPKD